MAYQDELAAANRLPTREQRLSARNAVRAKYGMETEKRKRGGIAGLYDRNKGVIQAALPTLAGFLVPGSSVLAGALTGGLARGLDRPGKRGIGLDLGQAARRAATGAALGKLGGGFRPTPAPPPPMPTTTFDASSGSWVPQGAEFTPVSPGAAGFEPTTLAQMPGSSAVGAPSMTVAPPVSGNLKPLPKMVSNRMTDRFNIGPNTMRSPIMSVPASAQASFSAALPAALPEAASAAVEAAAKSSPTMLQRLLTTIQKPEVLAPLAGGVADVIGSAQDRAVQERRIQLEEEQMRREQERQERLAQLLMPLFQQQVSQFGGQR